MKFIKVIANALISIIVFILILISMFISSSQKLISKENISVFISDADILNVDVNVLFNQEEIKITLKEKITNLAILNNIPNEIVEDILKSEEINEMLGDFFNQTITYVIEGGSKPNIQDESVNKIKEVANISLNDNLNIMIEEDELNNYIESFSKSIVDIVPERDEIINNSDMELFKIMINFNLIYLYIIILCLLLISIFINKKYYIPFKILGISMFVSGILFVIMGSLEYIVTNFIIKDIQGMQPFIMPLITNVLTIWFKQGIMISFTSLFLILIYITLNRMNKS